MKASGRPDRHIEHMANLVGILAVHAIERQAGKAGGQFPIHLSAG